MHKEFYVQLFFSINHNLSFELFFQTYYTIAALLGNSYVSILINQMHDDAGLSWHYFSLKIHFYRWHVAELSHSRDTRVFLPLALSAYRASEPMYFFPWTYWSSTTGRRREQRCVNRFPPRSSSRWSNSGVGRNL